MLNQLFGLNGSGWLFEPEDVIFSGKDDQSLPLLSVNFFDTNGANDSLIKSFRTGVAQWYYALRNIAIVASLAVLIYIGIRMAISSIASEKAMYKKMLKDWLVGFAVLFFLHYIMIIVIQLNTSIVNLIYNIMDNMGHSNGGDFETICGGLEGLLFSTSIIKGFMALVLLGCFLVITIMFFIMYMKRLFTVGFLIVISPLITITYSIDKLGDGKSQALDTWTKEFVYNVLIQPFHCILYVIFASAAVEALAKEATMANFIFALLALVFMVKAENIIKKIFGFEKAGSVEGMAAAGALAYNTLKSVRGAKQKVAGKVDKGSGTSSGSPGGVQRRNVPNVDGTNPSGTLGTGNTSGIGSNTNVGIDTTSNNSDIGNVGRGSVRDSLIKDAMTSGGTSKFKSAMEKTAIGRALQETGGNIKNSFEDFKADKSGTIKDLAGKAALKGGKVLVKGASKVAVGAMAAVATGNVATGAIVGYAHQGGRFTSKISSFADEDLDKMKLNTQKRRTAVEYLNYKAAHPDMSDNELYNKCADLLEVDPDRIEDPNEAKLAKQLQKMQSIYADGGSDKADAKTMTVIDDIQLGNIKNRVSINNNKARLNTAAVQKATSEFKNSNTGRTMDSNAIKEFVKNHMEKMDEFGKKYEKQQIFKDLDKNEKEFVKEIQKSKTIQKAIRKTSDAKISDETINKELIKAIEDKLNK